ncbi:MAG: AAA family ATPase [Dehalococcoidia bacterium]|nr:AAA family ATPase [Dehalococcoidia bacterium]
MKKPFQDWVKNELGDSFLLITTGLPATWKTETGDEIIKVKKCPMLRSDLIRLEVLKGQDVFDEKVAGNMDKRLSVYDELFRQADATLKMTGCALLDATFITQELRKRAAEIAAKNHRPLVILQTQCPGEVSLQRIARRTRENYESNAITEQAYLSNVSKFEPVDLDDIKQSYPDLLITHLVVDTSEGEQNKLYITSIEKR